TEIDDDGEKESISERHEGTYFKKEDKAVLLYTDQQNEIGEIKNFITVQPDKLSVKRSGAISMQQIFHVGRQTECMYKHPYGRSEEHTSELQSRFDLVCRLLLEKKKQNNTIINKLKTQLLTVKNITE